MSFHRKLPTVTFWEKKTERQKILVVPDSFMPSDIIENMIEEILFSPNHTKTKLVHFRRVYSKSSSQKFAPDCLLNYTISSCLCIILFLLCRDPRWLIHQVTRIINHNIQLGNMVIISGRSPSQENLQFK